MQIGDAVEYVDEVAKPHDALVTAIHGVGETPSVNLVLVTSDEAQTDQYGRQIKRETSVVHNSHQMAHGRFWREVG